MKENDYEKQANNFLTKTGTTFNIKYLKHDKHFEDDKETRDIYIFTFTRGERTFTGRFGNSINNSGEYFFWKGDGKKTRIRLRTNNKGKKIMTYERSILNSGNSTKNKDFKEPNSYDVLSSITKNDPEDFKNFCDNYGYDNNSIKANKIYEAVMTEWNEVQKIWSEQEIELLQEIN